MTVDIISVGNLKESYLREAVAEYEKRLGAYCTLRNLTFKNDNELPSLLERR
ncbi:MAG: 23S rRNA (pseudouridine(1915)-N(3))-methyltransferase RlmH, partial [Clostridia bacterium]|nr:23S rRNA (pseudouridine(1915)-N(3))-methyltransferase RlmH [Clostridia bacterium]